MLTKKISKLLAISCWIGSGLMILPTASPVFACSCALDSPDTYFQSAEVVFIGKVIDGMDVKSRAKLNNSAALVDWTFAVEKVLKGNISAQQTVFSPSSGASCGLEFQLGERYQVYAGRKENFLVTYLCSGTQPLKPAACLGHYLDPQSFWNRLIAQILKGLGLDGGDLSLC